MAIIVESTSKIRNLKTLSDSTIIEYVKEKLKNDDLSLMVTPYIYTACVVCKEGNIRIFTPQIDKSIHDMAEYFEKNPPMDNTEALFAIFGDLPMIAAIKDINDENHLDLKTTRDLCNSIGWTFLDPVEVKTATDLLTMVFQGIDKTMMKVAVWMNDSIYKLYSYDLGFLMGLYIPKPLRKTIQETNKSTIWYWLLRQSWIEDFEKKTACRGTYVDRIWSLMK